MDLSLSLESFEVEEPAEISLESLENELQSNRKQINELSRVSQDLAKRGMINRGVAESIATMKDRFPSLESHFEKYPVRSYTENFSRTNLKATQEGIVGGIVTAVINALKKIASWISGAFKWLWNMITGKKETVEKSVVVAEKTEEVLVVAEKVDLLAVFDEAMKVSEVKTRELEKTLKQSQDNLAKAQDHSRETSESMKRMAEEAKRNNEEMARKVEEQKKKQEWLNEQLKELEVDGEIGNFLNEIGKDITSLQETMFFHDQPVDVDGYKYHYTSIMVGLSNTILKSQTSIYDNANKFAQIVSMVPSAIDENMKHWDVALDQYIRQYTPKKEPILKNGETKFSLTIENIDKLTTKAMQSKVTKNIGDMRALKRSVSDCRAETVKYLRGLKAISNGDIAKEMEKVSIHVSKAASSLSKNELSKEQVESVSAASTLLQKTVNSVHRSIKVLEIFSDERIRYIKKVSSFAKTYVEKLSELERKGLLPDKYKSDYSRIIDFSKLKAVGR